ncbi:MAG TPA: Lrp/AsnC family transcriptional regulator [Pseudolabrys sp.]|nr:Lrp/AsnC family transcriptional regulator [Pseudolabrys sp.]
MTLTRTEFALLDRWQRGFPFVRRPFAVAGQSAGISERATLDIFERLRKQQMISRIGAIVRPQAVGASTLAAMRVAPDRLEEVAAIVSRQPCVSHNYERTNAFNLWFVVAGPDAQAVASTIGTIEDLTGLPVLHLPLQQAYHLDLGFPLQGGPHPRRVGSRFVPGFQPDTTDRQLLAAIEDGLAIVPQPYGNVADSIGLAETEVIRRLKRLAQSGVVTRFGCIVRHRKLGYTANAMAVWDVPDDEVDAAASALVRNERVTLCYRRKRLPPDWPYNLYCMVHARSRTDALAVVDDLNAASGLAQKKQTVLFSTRCFKQRGAVFSEQAQRVH